MVIITDPRTIQTDLNPCLVFWNQQGDIVCDGIDDVTDIPGDMPVAHAMCSIHQGKFASQGFTTYAEVPMENYMIENGWLGFVQLRYSNPQFVQAFANAVEAHLALPWYKKIYNWVEIFGQLIHQPEISFPGLFDCSMVDASELKAADVALPLSSKVVIDDISKYINPEQLWDLVIKNPDVFSILGAWDYKNGVLACGNTDGLNKKKILGTGNIPKVNFAN
jgi:hypothetical protein